MKIGSIYSASDKALFDALNQSTVSIADLRQLFLNHGIVISRATSRKALAAHFSRLAHDYDDFQALAKLFDTGQRRERSTSLRVESKAQLSDFEAAAHEIVEKLKADSDSASVSIGMDGTVQINVRYKTFHFNKSEFRQVETKDAVISLEQEGGTIVIRGPQNEKVDGICRDLMSVVEKTVDGKLDIDEISLEYFPEPTDRTLFFVKLIENVPGYKKHDVTDVYVFKPKTKESSTAISDEEADSVDQEDEEPVLGIHITRASLKGEGVLESDEMQSLISKGFYISKIVWQAKEALFDSDIFEFEAQFTEPESCTRFSYLIRGHYKYQGDKQYSKSKTQLDPADDKALSKNIDSSARKCIQILKASQTKAAKNEDKVA